MTDLELFLLLISQLGYQEIVNRIDPGYREYYVMVDGPHIKVELSLGIVFLFAQDGRFYVHGIGKG